MRPHRSLAKFLSDLPIFIGKLSNGVFRAIGQLLARFGQSIWGFYYGLEQRIVSIPATALLTLWAARSLVGLVVVGAALAWFGYWWALLGYLIVVAIALFMFFRMTPEDESGIKDKYRSSESSIKAALTWMLRAGLALTTSFVTYHSFHSSDAPSTYSASGIWKTVRSAADSRLSKWSTKDPSEVEEGNATQPQTQPAKEGHPEEAPKRQTFPVGSANTPTWLRMLRTNPILPGVGLAGIRLGDTQDVLTSTLGRPDSITPHRELNGTIFAHSAEYKVDGINLLFLMSLDKRIYHILLRDTDFNVHASLPSVATGGFIGAGESHILHVRGKPVRSEEHSTCPAAVGLKAVNLMYYGVTFCVCKSTGSVYWIALGNDGISKNLPQPISASQRW